jgi:hypothetical protein
MGRKTRRLGGQAHRDDHFARPENVLAVGFAARQEVEHLKRNFAPACSALDLDDGVVRDQGDAKIRGVGRDAVLAPAQDGVQPVVAAACVAPRAGRAFVAGARDIVEIRAARPLHEIAADGGGITKLRGGPRQERLGDGRKAPREIAIVREIGITDQRTDAHAAIGKVLDVVKIGKMGNVDYSFGLRCAALHQVQKVRAGSQIGGTGSCGGRDGLADRCRPDIFEGLHATSLRLAASSAFCASSTASVMP